MELLKNFVQTSTDIFVRVNELVAERLTALKIDEKYSNELLNTVHHIRDKNELYLELATVWSNMEIVFGMEEGPEKQEKMAEALDKLEKRSATIFNRRTDPKQSKCVDFLSDVEKFSDDMANKFIAFGLNTTGRKKTIFDLLVKYQQDFYKLQPAVNAGPDTVFAPFWEDFKKSISKAVQ